MDDLINDFLVETNESLQALDLDMVQLEQNPSDDEKINNIFRVMHTIKGTCGFIGLHRLASVAHAAENIMDKVRAHELSATPTIISTVLQAIDHIKALVQALEETGSEPAGDDSALIAKLNACAEGGGEAVAGHAEPAAAPVAEPSSKTPDLDGEIDFTPVMADFAADEGSDQPKNTGGKTPDLDGEIDFTPIKAEYGDSEAAALPKAPAAHAMTETDKSKALDEGMKVALNDKGGKAGGGAQQSIRVGLEVLEELMQMVGELVLTRNQLLQLTRSDKEHASSSLSTPLQRLNHITTELQEGVMKTRMQPISAAWAKFPRLIRDLSMELNKKIRLVMIGEETEIDRQMLEAIKDPLTHMVRNSADHGVEQPADRVKAGKTEEGTITLNAYHEGGHIIITITDDGKGLDVERIKAKALQNGLATEDQLAQMTEKQIHQFIFRAGFSTAEKITSVSGRGVGMDVVVTNIEKTGGTVEVSSTQGNGSVFTIKLPLTLAIMPVLIVEVSEQTFAIPQIRVAEILRVGGETKKNEPLSAEAEKGTVQTDAGHKIEMVNESPVLRLRGHLIPLISISHTLGISQASPSLDTLKTESFVVVCEVGSQTVGLVVDRVQHTEEIVVKPVSPLAAHLEVYSGCTILGNGRVIMILDPNGLIKQSGATDISDHKQNARNSNEMSFDDVTNFLMFSAWNKTQYIVPLELVARLEEVDMSQVEWSGESPVIQYRGGLMHLMTINPEQELPTTGTYDVIVFIDGTRVMGLVVERILDIVRQPMNLQSTSNIQGWIGAMVVDGKTTDMIDISYWFGKAFESWLGHKDASEIPGVIGEQKSMNVLLVDDSAFFRKFMQPVIKAAGYNVQVAEHGRKGLETLLANPKGFDLVVSDIDMPIMNGIDFVKQAKKEKSIAHIPFIALTSHTEEDLGGDAGNIGFAHFVMKSERDKLVATISKILHQQLEETA